MMMHIRRHLRNGWKWVEGWLEKGNHKQRPPDFLGIKTWGDPGYNPATDAFAVEMGGELIRSGPWAGRYRLDGLIVDRLGACIDTDECPECGGRPYFVRIRNPNPRAVPWAQAFTYCRRCVTPAMIAENERRVQATPPPSRRR